MPHRPPRFPQRHRGGTRWRWATALLAVLALPLRAEPPIVLGTTAAFSGPFAEYGEEYRKGADACLAGINAAGGVRGRTVRVDYMDDAYDPARTVANARELAARGVTGFVNLVGTGSLAALQPVLQELQIPVVGSSSGANQLRDPKLPGSRFVFHTKASYGEEFQGFARILPTIGLINLALVWQDNPFGKAGLENARAAFDQPGRKLPAVLLGTGPDKIDAAVQEVVRLRPQGVVLIAAGAAAPEFILKYQQAAGPQARVAVLSVVGGRGLTSRLGENIGGIMTSMVYPSPWNTSRQLVRDYQAAMARAGQPLSLLSLEGCLNLRFMVEGLKAAKAPTPAGLQAALEHGLVLDTGNFALRLQPGGQVASTYTSLGIYRANGRIME